MKNSILLRGIRKSGIMIKNGTVETGGGLYWRSRTGGISDRTVSG